MRHNAIPTDPPSGGASFVRGGGEAGALIRSIDWRTSHLGDAQEWPQSLRTAINLCVTSRFPIALYWGPEFVMLYNDDLLPMVGAHKHPQAMGRPAFEVLPEIRDIIEPLLLQVRTTGEAVWSEDLMLPLFREGAQSESYFTFTYSPIRDEAEAVAGVFCAVLETTEKVIEGRRLRLFSALAKVTSAQTTREACALAANELAHVASDVPFALMYLLDDSAQVATLAGASNIEPGTTLAPQRLTLDGPTPWWLTGFHVGQGLQTVECPNGPGGARGAVVVALERAGGDTPFGFMVLGLSPLLPPSPSYERFHRLLAASVSQAVSNAAAYEAERQRAEALAEIDRAKTAFFNNVSHEFRTPLTLMLAPLQDLRSLPAGAPIEHESIELVYRNSVRLLKLVNTLLEVSRLEAGRTRACYEPVDLASLTADLASSFRAAIEREGLSLTVSCPPLPEPVYVDRDMWEKIVLNLLSNAFKFTFEGSISVDVRDQGDNIVLRVADTGTGIAPEHLPHLFKRFHRIEGSRSRSHEGSGIGLSLIQELAHLHGGRIDVSSTLGVGTTFSVHIPRGKAHLPQDHIQSDRPSATTSVAAEAFVQEALQWARQSPDGPVSLSPCHSSAVRERIVFADDNADMRAYVARLLAERWDVETVNSGIDALAAIDRAPPDLVLCDVMMPGMDGFELVRRLRGDSATATTPVILLSARAGQEEAAKGLSSGADDYIAKPFGARDLVSRVASKLATAKVTRAMHERELLQRENLYRHFSQAPFPIAVFRGSEHVVELANPALLRAWGKKPDVIGLPLLQSLPELQDQPFLTYLNRVFETGVTYEGHAELARLRDVEGGEMRDAYFSFVYAPLHDLTGAIEGILVSAFEVTEIVLARRDSEEARRKAEAAEAAQRRLLEFQERFVAVLGHDLRGPIGALEMGVGILAQRADNDKDPTLTRVLNRMGSSTRRMARMVEQLLDLTRSRLGGGLSIRPAPMDVLVVLTGIVDEVRTAHPGRTLVLKCPSCSVTWDRDRLEQVFSNLVGNAIQHSPPNASVSIDVRGQEDEVEISVHNYGAPIPEAVRASLFNPFRRGERESRGAESAGLGLGLYISHEIVASHGGKLEVVSSSDGGTTFIVKLPRYAVSRRKALAP